MRSRATRRRQSAAPPIIEGSLNNKTEEGTGSIIVTPALAENIDCTITNDDDDVAEPMDLAITKTDDGLVKVAGGDSFDYTITVQNLGSGNLSAYEPAIVTDQLPDGFVFVAYPRTAWRTARRCTARLTRPSSRSTMHPS